MRATKRCEVFSPGNHAGWAVRVYIFLTQFLLWFGLKLPRNGSAKGGGIRDCPRQGPPG
jgi:hypothetical protein